MNVFKSKIREGAVTSTEEKDYLLLFSRGEVSRQAAMRALDVHYSQLLDMMADRSLPLPVLSDEDTNRMVEQFVGLFGQRK